MADNEKKIKMYFEDLQECTFDAIVETYAYIGEVAVRTAREDHAGNWKDHTGNLRSSIGYMVTYNGEEVLSNGFMPTKTKEGGTGVEGQAEGKKFIEGLKGTQSEGFALIVVAGMNYAEYVEAHENRDVLANAELEARRQLDKMMKRIPELVEEKMKNKGWK